MPHWMWPLMIVLVVMDATIVFVVMRRRMAVSMKEAGVDFARIHQVGRLVNERLVAHMQSSWSGQPSDLPEALRGAVEITRRTAAENAITLDDATLRLVVTSVVCVKKLVSRGEVTRAFKVLDGTSRTAAA